MTSDPVAPITSQGALRPITRIWIGSPDERMPDLGKRQLCREACDVAAVVRHAA